MQNKKKNNRKGCYKNTALGCDLKMILRSDRLMKLGKDYQGVLRRDVECEEFRYDEHFTFVETLPQVEKRNPRVFDGKFITITRRDDGTLRPNLKPIKNWTDFNAEEFAVGVANELLWALESVTVPNVPINI